MIRFESVSKQFPDGTTALNGVTLTVPDGKLTVIIGPSGCGKTTLMKLVNKLEVPTAGEIYINDQAISKLEEVKLRRSIGYVIQRIGLFPHMTVERNASLVPDLLGWPEEKTKKRVSDLLGMTGLEPETYMGRYPLELSGGQQQRVGVVRALAGDPDIVLMDEPFSALDPISREQLQDELQSWQKRIRKTIVFVTHDMDEALKIADYLVIMRNGTIEQTGTPQQVLEDPAGEFVETFIGPERIRRQQKLGERKVKDLPLLLPHRYDGQSVPLSSSATVEEAARLLRENPVVRLAIMEDGRLTGYMGETELLTALLLKEEEMEA